jgi:AcrR family transcriptional regulator
MVGNRCLLLEAATAAFAEHGVEAYMGEIAQSAGVAKGTVFRHFATKEDLLAAIMLRMLDRLSSTADRLLEADGAAAALREFMTVGIEVLAADRSVARSRCSRPGRVNKTLSAATSRERTSCCCSAASIERTRACCLCGRRSGAAVSSWPSTDRAPSTSARCRIGRTAACTSPRLLGSADLPGGIGYVWVVGSCLRVLMLSLL